MPAIILTLGVVVCLLTIQTIRVWGERWPSCSNSVGVAEAPSNVTAAAVALATTSAGALSKFHNADDDGGGNGSYEDGAESQL